MTNKEKASICSNCLTNITKSCHNGCIFFESYKAMEWKDQQFKEYLEKKKEEIERTEDADGFIAEMSLTAQSNLLAEIIHELFGKE